MPAVAESFWLAGAWLEGASGPDMASSETVILDSAGTSPLTLTGDTASGAVYQIEELDLGLAARRPTWVGGAESDGSLLVEDPPYDDATMTATVRLFPASDTMDAALAALNVLTLKLQECSASGPDGIACTYLAANASSTYTFYVKLAEYDGAPPITQNGELAGWFLNKPVVKLKLTRRPFFYAAENTTVTEAFGSNTIANFTFDSGASGNVSITGGVMDAAANFTTEDRMVRTAGVTYPSLYDAQSTVKATLGTTLSGFKAGVVLKRADANNYLEVYVDDTGAASRLRIDKVVAGVRTNLQSTAITRLVVSTAYWIRGRIEGNSVYAELWTAAPTNTGTAANAPAAYALTSGAEQTAFGTGVAGTYGLVWIPQQTAATLDDWVLEPNVAVSSSPLLTMLLPGVPGDVAAEARLIVIDRANQARRYLEWGLQQRFYQGLGLQLDNGSMTLLGGTSTTRASSVNTNVIRGTLTTSPSAVASTGNLSHIGTFRVRARVYASSASVYVRLSWQDGSGVFRANDYVLPPVNAGWADVDLGSITVTQTLSGTQQWSGRIEAYGAAGDTVDIDYLLFIPATEGYGKARGAYSYTAGAIVARDEFTGTTSGGALNARVAPAGGTWATSGSTTDLAFADVGSAEVVSRSTTADTGNGRFAIIGSTNYTDTEVSVKFEPATSPLNPFRAGVVLRWVDASNYLMAYVWAGGAGVLGGTVVLAQTVAGVTTNLATATPNVASLQPVAWYRIRCVAFASGIAFLDLFDPNGATLTSLSSSSTALATGGALASGKPGFNDFNNLGTSTRYYDEFYAATPNAEPIVLYGGRQAEIRSDSVIRQDSTGTSTGPTPRYTGAHLFVPPAGTGSRTSRIVARLVRNDVEAATYDNATGDSVQAQALVTPRFLLPR